jgi:ArsR family transcriptional regulator
MNIIDYALICKSMGDPTRLQIIKMLSQGEKCACKLLEAFDITQPTLSYHMKSLSECNLVSVRKEGKWSHYSMNQEVLGSFNDFIGDLSLKDQEASKCL